MVGTNWRTSAFLFGIIKHVRVYARHIGTQKCRRPCFYAFQQVALAALMPLTRQITLNFPVILTQKKESKRKSEAEKTKV